MVWPEICLGVISGWIAEDIVVNEFTHTESMRIMNNSSQHSSNRRMERFLRRRTREVEGKRKSVGL